MSKLKLSDLKRSPWFWAARDGQGWEDVYLFGKNPTWEPGLGEFYAEPDDDRLVGDLCYDIFHRCTGVTLKPGEKKRVRFYTEERK